MRFCDAFSKIRTLEQNLALHAESTDVTAVESWLHFSKCT
jgi:hypothetical protein